MIEQPPNLYDSLAQPFWEPIGKYVFKFGLLEGVIDSALSIVMKVKYDDVGMYIASELDLLTKLKLVKGIGDHDADSIRQLFSDKFKELENQNTFRNSLVHGAWTAHSESDHEHGVWGKAGLSRRYNFKAFYVTSEDLQTKTGELEALIETIRKALQSPSVRALSEPSLDKS